jgi:uncharacterized membrane protein
MPDISAFCPGCGRSVTSEEVEGETSVPGVAPLSRDGVLGSLSYVTVVPAIVFLLAPTLRQSRFVRFHSWQSILFAVATVCGGVITRLVFAMLAIFPVVGFLLAWLVTGLFGLAAVILWMLLIVKAALGEAYQPPGIGRVAARLSEGE